MEISKWQLLKQNLRDEGRALKEGRELPDGMPIGDSLCRSIEQATAGL